MQLFETLRPRTWSAVIGQDAAIQTIANVRTSIGTLRGQNWFFRGPSGSGKTTLARLIAEEVAPRPEYRMEVHADEITADLLRHIQTECQYRPWCDSGRAYIVNEVHLLTTRMVSRLLSALESGSPLMSWLFTTTSAGGLLFDDDKFDAGPFLSRCNELVLAVPDARLVASYLETVAASLGVNGLDRARYEWMARESHGNIRDCLNRLQTLPRKE